MPSTVGRSGGEERRERIVAVLQEKTIEGSDVDELLNDGEETTPAEAVDIQQGVKEFGDAVADAVATSGVQEKVEALASSLEYIEEYVSEWRNGRRGPDLDMFHALKTQVEEVQAEWEGLTSALQSQRERLDTLLRSFPGVVEVSSVKALALRVEHLERLMGQIIEERRAEKSSQNGRRQLIVSLAALGFTAVLWTAWIAMTFLMS